MCKRNYIQDCHGNSSIQQEDSFHQKNGMKFKDETSKVLHLEHNFVWRWNLNTSESISEIPGKIWNVLLVKDEQNHLDWLREEVLQSQRVEEYRANYKKKKV